MNKDEKNKEPLDTLTPEALEELSNGKGPDEDE